MRKEAGKADFERARGSPCVFFLKLGPGVNLVYMSSERRNVHKMSLRPSPDLFETIEELWDTKEGTQNRY